MWRYNGFSASSGALGGRYFPLRKQPAYTLLAVVTKYKGLQKCLKQPTNLVITIVPVHLWICRKRKID
jgi:hypothetical protein